MNSGLILDNSRVFNGITNSISQTGGVVQPGVVLDELNGALKPHGLLVSRGCLDGLPRHDRRNGGEQPCGGRSLRYGTMRDNVISIDAVMHDGTVAHFGPLERDRVRGNATFDLVAADMLALGSENARLIDERFPKLTRPRRRLQSRRAGSRRRPWT